MNAVLPSFISRTMLLWSVISMMAALLPGSRCEAQPPCKPFPLSSQIEVPAGEFSLADLLPPATCPKLMSAAAQVKIGRAPLEGSVRVLGAEDVRTLLDKAFANASPAFGQGKERDGIVVPSEIAIRRRGRRASCGDLVRQIVNRAAAENPERTQPPLSGAESAGHCGSAGRIAEDAPLALGEKRWDAPRRLWEISAHCQRPGDCVPFLIELAGNDVKPDTGKAPSREENTSPHPAARRANAAETSTPVVHRGERVTLLWDESGIRIVLPALSLDAGAPGDAVRARMLPSGRIMPAIVVGAGQLKTVS